MLRHAILIFFRNFKRYKAASLVNLFGLSIGLASSLLIYLWVNDELKMDHFGEKDSDRHYQVLRNANTPNGIQTREYTPGPLTKTLGQEFPEVDYAIPIIADAWYEGILSFESEYFRATPQFVGEGYFNVFNCDFVAGGKEAALADKNNIVISEKVAMTLFKSIDQAIGKTVTFKSEIFNGPYSVSGVFTPRNDASAKFDMLFSYDHFIEKRPGLTKWHNGGTHAHLVLNEGVDLDEFNAKIKDFLSTKIQNSNSTLFAQKYSEKYLFGRYENGVPVAGRVVYVRIFSLVAIFVLIVACINYMNLSTAQAARRIKEIGVKKAIGAQRKTLTYQCFGESMLMAFLSLILSIGIVTLLIPQFNQITEKQFSISESFGIILPAIIITAITGFISGIYPGLYLSSFKPVQALKGKMGGDAGVLWLRKGLVIFQFAVSVILMIAVIFTYRQIRFIQEVNLGYDNEHLISFRKEGKLLEDPGAFYAAAGNLPGVVSISSMCGSLPGDISGAYNVRWKDQKTKEKNTDFSFIEGGRDMAKVLNVELLSGRLLSNEFPTDESAVVINETAAKIMGYENPVGEKLYRGGMYTIVGMVKDFHFDGQFGEIGPFYFVVDEECENFVAKIEAENQRETIDRIKALHESFNPGYPFEFNFMDENYDQLYKEEKRIATLSKYFAGIAIAVSCLGLLALTAFSTQRRFKEIAIRKITGSSQQALMTQILSESFFFNLTALLISATLLLSFADVLEPITGFSFQLTVEHTWLYLGVVLGLGTLGAGFYPAFVLSKFQAALVLKGNFGTSKKGLALRKSLLTFQFMVALVLFTGTLSVYRQVSFLRERDLGLNIDQVLVTHMPNIRDDRFWGDYDRFKNALISDPGITLVTTSNEVPGNYMERVEFFRKKGQAEHEAKILNGIWIDFDYFDLFEMELLAGRKFDQDITVENRTGVILNANASKLLGFSTPEEAIDQPVDWIHVSGESEPYKVIGVVNDYDQRALSGTMPMVFIMNRPQAPWYEVYLIAIRLNTQDLNRTMDFVKEEYERVYAQGTFDSFFLDEHFNHQYESDTRFGKIFGIFSAVAIFIAVLGLFGLTSFMLLQKRKEISVRRVLGAHFNHILQLISKEFLIQLGVAVAVAVPVVLYGLKVWLARFPQQIAIEANLFFQPITTLAVIVLLVVVYQSITAVRVNPTENLRE